MRVQIDHTKNLVKVTGIQPFQLADTLYSGQSFRWKEIENGGFAIAAGNHQVKAWQKGRRLELDCSPEEARRFWAPYFDLKADYAELQENLKKDDPVMADAIAFGGGIRIMRQDLWETMVMFILSQNNNIPRIQGCVERLAEAGGERMSEPGAFTFVIPEPERLAEFSAEEIASVRAGYRGKYLIGTARRVCERGLPETREELLACPGIGPKVASCIELFGRHDLAAFPIDVWVMRLMNRLYGFDERNQKGMQAFAEARFGEFAGLAQQYLFYYMRSGLTD